MLCLRPLKLPHATVGCGKCDTCIINRRRVWIARLMLESREHPAAFFITLTYKEECLPNGANLDKSRLQLFFKLLRRRIEPAKLRYFAVGEYGGRTGRPHYHAVLFTDIWVDQHLLQSVWEDGFVDVKLFSEGLASYIAGYVVAESDDSRRTRVAGRVNEFALQSLKPGIGYGVVPAIAHEVLSKYGVSYLTQAADCPSTFRLNGKLWPVGPYIKRKVIEHAGLEPGYIQREKRRKRIDQPTLTKEDVALREQRRKHGAHSASKKIKLHKWSQSL